MARRLRAPSPMADDRRTARRLPVGSSVLELASDVLGEIRKSQDDRQTRDADRRPRLSVTAPADCSSCSIRAAGRCS